MAWLKALYLIWQEAGPISYWWRISDQIKEAHPEPEQSIRAPAY